MTAKSIGILYQPLGNPSRHNPYCLGIERMITAATASGYTSQVFVPAGTSPHSLPQGQYTLVSCPTSFSKADTSAAVETIITHHGRTPLHRLFAEQECTVELGALCRQAGNISGLAPQQAQRFRNKDTMARAAETIGLHVPRAHAATSHPEIAAFAELVGWPLIVKPIDGAGSDGIVKIESSVDLDRLWPTIVSHLERWRFEEYICGIEYHIDSIVRGGEIVFVRLSRYLGHVLDFRTCAPGSVIRQDDLSASEQAILHSDDMVLQSFGFANGVSHNEYYVRNDEVIFGEAAARVGGGHAVPMIEAATGINLFDARVRLELDLDYQPLLLQSVEIGGQMLPARRSGRITNISTIDTRMSQDVGVFDVVHWFDIGDVLAAATRSSRMFGYVLARGSNYAEIAARLALVRDQFWVETDESSTHHNPKNRAAAG